MAREKEGYRDMLEFLVTVKNVPNVLSRSQAATAIGISRGRVAELIACGTLEVDKTTNKIPIGSIAKYLCG